MRILFMLALAASTSLTAISCTKKANLDSTSMNSPMMVSATPTQDEYKTFRKSEERYMKELALDDATMSRYTAIDTKYRRDLRSASKGYSDSDRDALVRQMRDKRAKDLQGVFSASQYSAYERMENNLGTARERFYVETDFK